MLLSIREKTELYLCLEPAFSIISLNDYRKEKNYISQIALSAP